MQLGDVEFNVEYPTREGGKAVIYRMSLSQEYFIGAVLRYVVVEETWDWRACMWNVEGIDPLASHTVLPVRGGPGEWAILLTEPLKVLLPVEIPPGARYVKHKPGKWVTETKFYSVEDHMVAKGQNAILVEDWLASLETGSEDA